MIEGGGKIKIKTFLSVFVNAKCRGSKTPYPGYPSASYKDVWGQYAWVVAPARADRCSLQSGVHNPASNDLPHFHPLENSNRQLFTVAYLLVFFFFLFLFFPNWIALRFFLNLSEIAGRRRRKQRIVENIFVQVEEEKWRV